MIHLRNGVDDCMLIEMCRVMCLGCICDADGSTSLKFCLVHLANLQLHVMVVYKTSGVRRQRF